MRPDEFRQLRPGEAIVATTLGPPPEQVTVTPGPVLEHEHVPRPHGLPRDHRARSALPHPTTSDATDDEPTTRHSAEAPIARQRPRRAQDERGALWD